MLTNGTKLDQVVICIFVNLTESIPKRFGIKKVSTEHFVFICTCQFFLYVINWVVSRLCFRGLRRGGALSGLRGGGVGLREGAKAAQQTQAAGSLLAGTGIRAGAPL